MKKLRKSEISFITASGDPLGRTFVYEDGIYRGIYPDKVEYVKSLFTSGLIDRLIDKGLLIPTEITDLQLDEFSLVLKHKKIEFTTPNMFWPRTVLLDAAKLVVDLNLELLPYSLGTIDYHTQNIYISSDSKPVWTDFGSIVPINMDFVGLIPDEFIEYLLNPLLLYSLNADTSFACRQLLIKECITNTELSALTNLKIEHLPANRQGWLTSIKQWLDSLVLPSKQTIWTEYYAKKEEFKLQQEKIDYEPNTREGIVQQLIRKHKPKKIIDIACNAGAFTMIAVYEGANVHAIDKDDSAIELFYEKLKEQNLHLPITLSVRDIDYWYAQAIYPTKAEMVLAMAITHHLSLGQKLPLHRIAWLLSQYTSDILITDFMPKGLGIDRIVPNPLPVFYTLENLINAFKPYFRDVKTIGPTDSHRVVIYCEGRNDISWASINK